MSRHRFVRNINIHDELDDNFDDEEDPFEGITPEQQAQLDAATETVTSLLGPEKDSLLSVAEIKQALWDNYFDVDETLQWAFDEQKKRKNKEKKDEEDPLVQPQPPKPLSPLAKLAAAKSSSSGSVPKPSSLAALASKAASVSPRPSPAAGKPSLASLAAAGARKVADAKRSPASNTVATPKPPVVTHSSKKLDALAPAAAPAPSKLSLLAQANSRKAPALSDASLVKVTNMTTAASGTPKAPSKLQLKVQKAREAASTKLPDSQEQGLEKTKHDSMQIKERPLRDHADEVEIDPLFPLIPRSADPALANLSLHEPNSLVVQAVIPGRSLLATASPFASLLVPPQQTPMQSQRLKNGRLHLKEPTFAFDTPSPDDVVMSKREGTRLAAAIKASGGAKKAGSLLEKATASKTASGVAEKLRVGEKN